MANSTTLYQGNDGRTYVDVTENKVLTLADCGIVQNVIADAITVTLPATSAGACFTVRNGGVPASSSLGAPTGSDFSALVTISPNSADKIQGYALTAADDKDLLNTKATAHVGDEVRLVGDGTDGYLINQIKGTWTRQS